MITVKELIIKGGLREDTWNNLDVEYYTAAEVEYLGEPLVAYIRVHVDCLFYKYSA